jgi:hypothetical protein
LSPTYSGIWKISPQFYFSALVALSVGNAQGKKQQKKLTILLQASRTWLDNKNNQVMIIQCLTKEKNRVEKIADNEYHSQVYMQSFLKAHIVLRSFHIS